MFFPNFPAPYSHFTKQEESMPKYMIQASYTADGTKGVMKEGGTKRRATVEANVKAAGRYG
jgi:uncharacterized protein with GYD domain